MKAIELRIGNLLNFHGKVRPVTAYEIYKLNDGACFDESPIPITEEWLYKLGAVKFPSGKMLSLYNRLIDYMDCRGVWIDTQTSVELKYVHQIQNLYFALTGTELEIKEQCQA